MEDDEIVIKDILVNHAVMLGSLYRHSMRIDNFLTLYKCIAEIVPEFSDVAIANIAVMESVTLNQDSPEIKSSYIKILKDSKFGNDAILAINLNYLLNKLGSDNPPYSSQDNFNTFLTILKSACLLNKGFSFIRVSDGEGCLLSGTFLKDAYQLNIDLSHYENSIFQRWTGQNFNSALGDSIYNDLVVAISNADGIGGICASEEEFIFNKCKYSAEFNLFESYFGSVISRLFLRANNIGSIYPASNANIFFSKGNILEIIRLTKKTPVFIGPVDISNLVTGSFQKFIKVTPRYIDKNYEQGQCLHIIFKYNAFFNEEILPFVTNDKIFFISAGISGKILSNLVKNCGGFAIDIGSATDYIYGFASR
jgi:hypothetical protein